MDTIENRYGQIPSIRVSTELVSEVARLIFEASQKVMDTPSLVVQIFEPKRIRSFSSVEEIKSFKLPPKINGIQITVGHEYGDPESPFDAHVSFNFVDPLAGKYDLFGPGESEMNGLETTLKDRWNNDRNWNYLAHKRPWQGIIVVLATLGILLVTARVLMRLGMLDLQNSSEIIGLGIIGVGIYLVLTGPLRKFMKWMFPYFSYPEDANGRYRHWVRWTVGVAVAIVGVLSLI